MNKKRYVLGFLFDPHWEAVLLILKNRPDWQRNRYNGIGGKIEEGEVPSEAMQREFREETGVTLEKWTYFAAMQFSGEEVYYFYACGAEIVMSSSITDETVAICDINDLPANCLSNVPWLVQMAKCHHVYDLKYTHEVFEDAIACGIIKP